MKKLYYEDEHGEFYWVSETPKTFKIEWVEKLSGGEPLDQNVRWDKLLTVKKENYRSKHCLKSYGKTGILIYPYRAGQPFYLEPANIDHIEKEIADCISWGVSTEYYENLKQYLTIS